MFVGEVVAAHYDENKKPLVFYGGKMKVLG
ncbi:flavin reductase family protein [Calderihabitans maritimus]